MTDGDPARVGIVFVSHSAELANGIAEVAGQMAPSVALVAAGGTDGGGIGTSFVKVTSAIDEADAGAGAVVLSDLGSALMIAETVHDQLPDDQRLRVAIVDAPFVEGGVAAAVAAETGGDLVAVVAAAEGARQAWEGMAESASPPASGAGSAGSGPSSEVRFVRDVTLRNKDGLHARPAAEFVKLANTFDVKVTVNGKDARSLLGIMSLGLNVGASAEIVSNDPDGEAAVNALADLVESGFGEALADT
ncbi:HPr family phosphocarrier protein [Diaminobutyricibacter tongyongensis]|uniref:Phosphocarrier protein HPr n=1 Tax=Leifsonia tongyongensis TaxID=1268043 RepID=A0A6L9XXW1_9MICO|nr:dihydroxyacetone kinase phosphoryl donor subunit DhaM [Diaminobutyricibacter tongyongensis]NEN06126.1 HPr family phosphocarrier protein [Diaminobutyricibacter tongyongensis]